MSVSQLGFKNTIQPTPHSSPLSVHFGGERLAFDDMHIVTHILRLMASDRARCVANVKSALIPRIALLETKVPSAGAARDVMMANMAIVTISSINVKPRCEFVIALMRLIVSYQEINRYPLIRPTQPFVQVCMWRSFNQNPDQPRGPIKATLLSDVIKWPKHPESMACRAAEDLISIPSLHACVPFLHSTSLGESRREFAAHLPQPSRRLRHH